MSDAESAADEKSLRLTEAVRKALLAANEGYTDSTYYQGKNFREQRDYEIVDGELQVRSRSKTSWADSRRDDTYIADESATHRFLRENLAVLNTDGVREHAAEMEPELRAARKEARKAEAEAKAQRDAEAAERDQDASDEAQRSGLSTGQKVAIGVGIMTALGIGHKVWDGKVRPWWNERRARRASERAIESSEGVDPSEHS